MSLTSFSLSARAWANGWRWRWLSGTRSNAAATLMIPRIMVKKNALLQLGRSESEINIVGRGK
eukprot:scaffold113_cov78-Skeletonema_dohrnii-CCMP3373.AAC.7